MGADGAGRDRVTIKIPRPLYDKIRVAIAESRVRLRDGLHLSTSSAISWPRAGRARMQLPEEALRTMKERLRNLGYL